MVLQLSLPTKFTVKTVLFVLLSNTDFSFPVFSFEIWKETKTWNAWGKVGELLCKTYLKYDLHVQTGFGPLSILWLVIENWWDFCEWLVVVVVWWFHKEKNNVFLFCNVSKVMCVTVFVDFLDNSSFVDFQDFLILLTQLLKEGNTMYLTINC